MSIRIGILYIYLRTMEKVLTFQKEFFAALSFPLEISKQKE